MPIFTHMPDWSQLRSFFDKLRPMVPEDYTGYVGISLHRTGNPLTVELFGPDLPEPPLSPMAIIELEEGKLTKDWDELETEFDVPWVYPSDFHNYRDNVMRFYHAEDQLEMAAEKILNSGERDEELFQGALVDRTGAMA